MSSYLVKSRGWRYDFTLNGQRFTESWFKTKREALQAEAQRREELRNPQTASETPTDMSFLELVNLRLDNVKMYNSDRHYQEHRYMARRWVQRWGKLNVRQINQTMVERFISERARVSPFTANKEIRYLRATFNFAQKKKLVTENPLTGIGFLPMERRVKYVPSAGDIDRIIAIADPETQDYLWAIRETMARVSEINRLTWDDVSL